MPYRYRVSEVLVESERIHPFGDEGPHECHRNRRNERSLPVIGATRTQLGPLEALYGHPKGRCPIRFSIEKRLSPPISRIIRHCLAWPPYRSERVEDVGKAPCGSSEIDRRCGMREGHLRLALFGWSISLNRPMANGVVAKSIRCPSCPVLHNLIRG